MDSVLGVKIVNSLMRVFDVNQESMFVPWTVHVTNKAVFILEMFVNIVSKVNGDQSQVVHTDISIHKTIWIPAASQKKIHPSIT